VRCDGACDVMTLPVLLFCSPIMKLLEPAHRTTCCCKHAPLMVSRSSTGTSTGRGNEISEDGNGGAETPATSPR
jgi:hypothetical protein